jgi:hypothetical protein
MCKIYEIMDILYLGNKGRQLETLEKYYLYLDKKLIIR